MIIIDDKRYKVTHYVWRLLTNIDKQNEDLFTQNYLKIILLKNAV